MPLWPCRTAPFTVFENRRPDGTLGQSNGLHHGDLTRHTVHHMREGEWQAASIIDLCRVRGLYEVQ